MRRDSSGYGTVDSVVELRFRLEMTTDRNLRLNRVDMYFWMGIIEIGVEPE